MSSFEYSKSEFHSLAFTVKKLGNDVSILDYHNNVLNKWSRLGVDIKEPYFEEDNSGKLHMHGVLVTRKNYYKRKLQVDGYYVFITDIWNLDRWLEYCAKVKHTQTIDNTQYLF